MSRVARQIPMESLAKNVRKKVELPDSVTSRAGLGAWLRRRDVDALRVVAHDYGREQLEPPTVEKRGRPSEQLKRETSEGRVWTIVSKLRESGDFGRTIREIARLSRCSVGAVAKTMAWRGYLQERKTAANQRRIIRSVGTRQRRLAQSVEGRVIQIVKEASARDDFSLTVRRIAETIRCSVAAVGKTQAWEGYVRAREADKEASRSRRRGQRIR